MTFHIVVTRVKEDNICKLFKHSIKEIHQNNWNGGAILTKFKGYVLDDLTIDLQTWNHSGEHQGPPGSGANSPMLCISIDFFF